MAEGECRWSPPQQWSEWSEWLSDGLHARNRWRLPVLMIGLLFAQGRRTVTTWLRAAGVSDQFDNYYYFLGSLGRNSKLVATSLAVVILRRLPPPERVLLTIDDSPIKRYRRKVEGADIHRNPTSGPAKHKYLYGHIWVTISLAIRHPVFGALGLPLLALLYVRQRALPALAQKRRWKFATKLELAADLVRWIAPILQAADKLVWVVVDGGYTKLPFLKPAQAAGVVVVGRLRKDARLNDVPVQPKRRPRGGPRKYGKNTISLAKRAGHKGGWQQMTCSM